MYAQAVAPITISKAKPKPMEETANNPSFRTKIDLFRTFYSKEKRRKTSNTMFDLLI